MAKVQKAGNGKQVHNMNSPERLEAIKAAIIAGESPRAIHEKYGTSIVNIHYHKTQLRKQGLLGDTPKSKAGRKPGAAVAAPAKKVTASKAPKATKVVASKAKAKAAPKATAAKVVKATKVAAPKAVAKKVPVVSAAVTSGKGIVSVVVNGTKITTDKPVKAYKVSKKSVLIEF